MIIQLNEYEQAIVDEYAKRNKVSATTITDSLESQYSSNLEQDVSDLVTYMDEEQ